MPEFYKKSKTLSIMFSCPNLLLDLRHALYFERRKREATKSLLPEWCLMLTNNIPSLSLSGSKEIGDLNFNDFTCSVFSSPGFASSVDTVEKASLV